MTDKITERVAGYYWAMRVDFPFWQIFGFTGDADAFWWECGSDRIFFEKDMAEIDETQIIRNEPASKSD